MAIQVSDTLQVIGALFFFIYGMKMMSDGIQRAAGDQLRNILRTMTKNRFFGVATGFLTTALVQSSSATTVMTVSFVNAGLLTLVESAGIMMGANVGTTITGWLVSVLGFQVNLSAYSIPLFAIAVPAIFYNRGRLKYWGEFIMGFAILFLGLTFMREALPDPKQYPEILNFLSKFADNGIWSRILFVLIGALTTIIVQSSSAAMAVTLTMCSLGYLEFEIAAAMILGENIGTTITAEVASLVGTRNARRSARIHSMFNIIGVAWMVILLPFFLPIVANTTQAILGISDPYINARDMPIALSAFHTAFNISNMIIMLGFVNALVKIAKWTLPDRPSDEDEDRLKFINTTYRTPELATEELIKETIHFGEITARMLNFTSELLNSTESRTQSDLHKKISKYEKITDRMEGEISDYIMKLSNSQITPQTSKKLTSILNICKNLEQIGDLFDQMSITIQVKNQNKSYFIPEQRNNINEMIGLVKVSFLEMNKNLSKNNFTSKDLQSAKEMKAKVTELRLELNKKNNDQLGSDGYKKDSAIIYNTMYNSLESVSNSIYNINEAMANDV